jgi:MYXO-CTERM domain-containing protein
MQNALRTLVRAAVLLGALLVLPRYALAAGTVSLASREPTEVDGKWKLNMTIDFGSVPQLPHIPMIFAFQPMVLYERSLTDKSPEKPVLIRMPLQNQQAINESMDVGFANASGQVFKITKFDFVIRRDHGFEAGEYDLKIKREDDGVQMGQTIRLILKGDNPIVDRRAIVFAGEKKKKVTEDKGKADKPAEEEKKPAEAPAEEAKTDAPADPNAPPAVPPKQGGCGCLLAGDEAPGSAGALAALALGAVVVGRRRRR